MQLQRSQFRNSRFSVIKTPVENLKPTKIRKTPDRLSSDQRPIKFDNLKYNYGKKKIHVSVDLIYGDLTINSGKVSVNQDYGKNPLGSAVTIAQNQAKEKLLAELNK